MIDSEAVRRLARSGPGSRVLRSRPYRALDTARRFATTSLQVVRDPGRFRDVETLCLFIGHVKSGGTLLGALLDAHPDAAIADELDVLRWVDAGFRRDQIFQLLIRGSRREAERGRVTARRLAPYSLAVPGQWQGRYRRLRVIGDSRAGPTTRRFGRRPELLGRLDRRLRGVRARFIHVVREPFDPVAAMVVRGGRSVEDAIDDYAQQCRALIGLRARIPSDDLLTVPYEAFVNDPVDGLREACRFVGLDADPAYVRAASAIVDPSVRRERELVEWRPRHVYAVRRLVAETSFLRRYECEAHRDGA